MNADQYSTASSSSYKGGPSGRMSQEKLEASNLQSTSIKSPPTISKSTVRFIDSHCHIDILLKNENFQGSYKDYISKNKKTYPASYKGCIAVFCKPFTFAKVSMWQKHLALENVWGAFGVHPKNAREYNDKIEGYLLAALQHPKVKALGEIGLNYSDRFFQLTIWP